MLVKSFCIGLQSLSTRTKMESLLPEGNIPDEVLMERLDAAVAT